jgi:hypothetical protein
MEITSEPRTENREKANALLSFVPQFPQTFDMRVPGYLCLRRFMAGAKAPLYDNPTWLKPAKHVNTQVLESPSGDLGLGSRKASSLWRQERASQETPPILFLGSRFFFSKFA